MKKIVLGLIIFSLVVGIIIFFLKPKPQQKAAQTKRDSEEQMIQKNVELSPFPKIHASFAIFTNGTMRSFAAPKYHTLSPNVFITAQQPNIVTVTVPNATWNEFFLSLPMRLNPECLTTGDDERFCNGPEGKMSFFINGVEDKRALIKPIKQGDSLLVTFGNETKEQIQSQISKIPKLPQN